MWLNPKDLGVSFLAFLYWLVMALLNQTYRFKSIGLEHVGKVKGEEGNAIFAFWHRSTFPLFYYYHTTFPKWKATLFTTNTRRGRVIAYLGQRFNLDHIDVPMAVDFTGGAKGALQMLKAMKSGEDCLIAVDGPRGPIFKIKPGIIYLSQKAGKTIFPVGIGASRKLVFKRRWDKYFIPYPFARVVIAFGEPFKISPQMDLEGINKKCTELEEALHSLTKQAEAEASSI